VTFESPQEGDRALLIFPDGNERIVLLKKGKSLITKYGVIKHEDILKGEWGSEVVTSTGFKVMIQKPTFDEIIYSQFSRKTQVIYEKDAALMIAESGIDEGFMVGESGVGSGFLTAHILRVIKNKEKYWGYEIREDMVEKAIENLKILGLDISDRIKVKDVRKGIEERGFHAFFLDLPEPWEALKSLHNSLLSFARVVVFVPSANQVIKTLSDEIVKQKYHIHKVFEVISREYEKEGEALRPKFFQKMFSGYIMVFLRKKGSE
jgi:tRNA (adenine57-N1/adenine58-N1)-methyltransferase